MPRAYHIHDLHIKILDKLMSVICKKVQNIYLYINVHNAQNKNQFRAYCDIFVAS